MKAVQVTEFGGPEVLTLVDLPDPVAPPGTVSIDVARAGINYADTHAVENSYLSAQTLPMIPGAEAVGRTLDGRRVVALCTGGYAERVVTLPDLVFDLPDAVSDGAALALVLQGTTAWHLLRTSGRLADGEAVVVHAAAGGVGTLAVQLARRWGAGRIIATASSESKRALAIELGADVAVDPAEPDLAAALREANGGRRIDLVLEMTGGPVFDASLAVLAPFGRVVTYGMASRQAPKPVAAGELLSGSKAVIGFWLAHCFTRPQLLRAAMDELIALTASGELHPVIGGEYPMSAVRQAHEDLRARRTTGKLILDPSA